VTELDLGARAGERQLLTGFLDWNRAIVEHKVEGLSQDAARRVMTPSGVSPLGIVNHLAWTERTWMRARFAGENVPLSFGADGTNTVQFELARDDTTASVVAFYTSEVEESRRIVAATPSLDQLSQQPAPLYGHFTLRWVLMHLLEETARHLGHLDIMREAIDGRTGS